MRNSFPVVFVTHMAVGYSPSPEIRNSPVFFSILDYRLAVSSITFTTDICISPGHPPGHGIILQDKKSIEIQTLYKLYKCTNVS